MARSTAKARTAPSAPRQGQCSTTSELSRKPGSQFLQVERFSHCTLAPTKNDRSASLSVRINPKGPGEYVHTRNCWLGALTLVVVILLTRRYDFWRATGEPLPKPSVTPPSAPPSSRRSPRPPSLTLPSSCCSSSPRRSGCGPRRPERHHSAHKELFGPLKSRIHRS